MDAIRVTLLVSAPIIVVGIALYLLRQRTKPTDIMNDPINHSDKKPDKTLLSICLFVLGVLSLVVSGIVVFTQSDGIFKALPGLAVAAVFFALSRTLDYLNESLSGRNGFKRNWRERVTRRDCLA